MCGVWDLGFRAWGLGFMGPSWLAIPPMSPTRGCSFMARESKSGVCQSLLWAVALTTTKNPSTLKDIKTEFTLNRSAFFWPAGGRSMLLHR